jgi:hypothetical protein
MGMVIVRALWETFSHARIAVTDPTVNFIDTDSDAVFTIIWSARNLICESIFQWPFLSRGNMEKPG